MGLTELEMAQERFCELEVRSIAIIQCEELREENGGGVWGPDRVPVTSRIIPSSLTYM